MKLPGWLHDHESITLIAPDVEEVAASICPVCRVSLTGLPRYTRYGVCDECGFYFPLPARQRIQGIVDADSFVETEADLSSADPLEFVDDLPYRDRLRDIQDATGQADAIVTGRAALHGHDIVIAILDFGFLGGSMGVVVGEKLARASELALAERRPLVTVVASGGARMQEGMLSLLQMAKTAAAVQRLRAERIPFLSVLTHPTTGGVFASFASLGDVIVAEPRALIGFAGPRVAEQVLGRPLPPGSHSAEFLFAHGMIDGVVERVSLRSYLGQVLDVIDHRDGRARPTRSDQLAGGSARVNAWETVLEARHPDRPTTVDYISLMFDLFVELHGDRESGDDPAIVAGLGVLVDRAVAVVGIERGRGRSREWRREGRPLPEGYRKARRVMGLAERFAIPLITLVDTPGAYPGIESEERGLARQIAESLALMSQLPVPVVAAITGEGGSGGALALAVADRVLMLERAIYSVIAPEGAATILYRDAARAPEMAERLRLTAHDVLRAGIADRIVPEPEGGAKANPTEAAMQLKAAVIAALDSLDGRKPDKLVADRYRRYRAVGTAFVHSRPARR